jgi:hypothetical protein
MWRGQRLVSALFGELEEASKNPAAIEEAIEDETAHDDNGKRRSMMLRAVAIPSRAGVIVNLSSALRTLVAIERQAFMSQTTNLRAAAQKRDAQKLSLHVWVPR